MFLFIKIKLELEIGDKMTHWINMLKGKLEKRGKGLRMKALFLSATLFFVAACPAPGPECVDADEWGNIENITVSVDPKDRYTTTGISVGADNNIEVKVSGLIDICADDITLGPTNYFADELQVPETMRENYDKYPLAKENLPLPTGFVTEGTNPIDPWIDGWQDSGITVEEGSKLTIKVSGSYFDRSREQMDGRGLYAYIGQTAPPNSDWWYGAEGSSQPEENKRVTDGAAYPEFFELFDNGTVGEGGGFSWTVPESANGNIWFRYARSADARGIQASGNGQYSPWRGVYAWEEVRCELCMHTVIAATCLAVSPLPFLIPVCIAAWEAGCASTGHLEAGPGEEGKNCREHLTTPGDDDDPTDHWINNDYLGSGADEYYNRGNGDSPAENANSGGYDISVGFGCPGTFGRYMEMHIGSSSVELVDQTEPPGCIVGEDLDGDGQVDPCEIVLDEWGEQPIKIAKYDMSNPDMTSMDLRGLDQSGTAINGYPDPPYSRIGTYDGPLPASGELFFFIRDEASSVSYPEPGYYGDNTGSYTVKVKTMKVDTGFSRFMQMLIDPVRGLVFGYCRVEDNPDTPLDESKAKYTTSEEACGDAWLPGITKRMYNKLVGGTIEYSTGSSRIEVVGQDEDGNDILEEVIQTDVGTVVGNPFLNALRAALILYIVIYGGLFMMGMVDDTQEDFTKRALRYAIVATLLSPGSWEFFSVNLFAAFTDGIDDLIVIMTSEFSGSVSSVLVDPVTGYAIVDSDGDNVATGGSSYNIFAFADQTMSMFFHHETFIKIAGLLFSSPIGFLYVILIFVGMFYYVGALITALILYLLAILAIALLLILAPLFLSMILFDKTREYFDGWFYNLLNYLAQPVFVFATLAIFNVFVYSAIYTLLYYRVCWDTVVSLDFGLFDIPIFKFYLPDGPSGLPGVPVQFFMILIFLIICNAMLKFIDWMSEMAATLTSGAKSTSLAGNAAASYSKVTAFAFGWASTAVGAASNIAKGTATGGKAGAAKAAMESGGDIGKKAGRDALGSVGPDLKD